MTSPKGFCVGGYSRLGIFSFVTCFEKNLCTQIYVTQRVCDVYESCRLAAEVWVVELRASHARWVTNVFEAYFKCLPLGILSGIVIIPGTAGGIFLGSYLIKRVDVRRSCKIAAKYCFIFQFIGTWAVLTFLIPGCKTTLLAGISHPYNNKYVKLSDQSSYSPY